jgi:hypothetical protein
MAVLTPVRTQVLGGALATAGVAVQWGTGWSLICAGVLTIIGGAVAEVSAGDPASINEEGVPDAGTRTSS